MRFKLFGKFERRTHGQVIPSGSSRCTSHGFSSSLWPQQSQKRGLVSSSVGKWKNKRGSQESNISKTVLWSCMFVKPSQYFIITFTMVSSVQIFYSAVLEWGLHHAVNLFSDFRILFSPYIPTMFMERKPSNITAPLLCESIWTGFWSVEKGTGHDYCPVDFYPPAPSASG